MFSRKQIWALLIPLMIEQVLTALMGTADTMMVANVGSAAISAVSLVDSINVLIIQVFAALATGGAVICAQHLGRRESGEATAVGKQLLFTVLVLSLTMALAIIPLRRPLLRLIFGTVDAEVMTNALSYLLITALSYPFIALYNAGAALFRVDGNSRLPMMVSVVCNLINIVLNALFIFHFGMGVVGAALATLISRVLCAVTILYELRRPRQAIVVRDYMRVRPDFRCILGILSIGLPAGIENSMFQFGKLAVQSSVSTLSTIAIAGQAMTATIEASLTATAQTGIGLGMMTLVGQCMGARREDEARRYILQLTGYAEIVTIVVCALSAVLVRPITVLAGMEPEAARLTVGLTYLIAIVKPIFWTLSFIPAYGMRAAGDVRYAMIVSSCTMWIFRVAVVTILIRVFGFGPLAVWIGMFADWIARGTAFTLRFFSGKWAKHQVIQD